MALSCLPIEVACFEIMARIYVWFVAFVLTSSVARKHGKIPCGSVVIFVDCACICQNAYIRFQGVTSALIDKWIIQ